MGIIREVKNETNNIYPYNDDVIADKWSKDSGGRWVSEIKLVRNPDAVEYVVDVSMEDGIVPILVAGYYQIEVEVVMQIEVHLEENISRV